MSWLDKILPPKIKREDKNASVVMEGLYGANARLVRPLCMPLIWRATIMLPQMQSPQRDDRARADQFVAGRKRPRRNRSYVKPTDILKFKDSKKYPDRLTAARKAGRRRRCLGGDEGRHERLAGGGGRI